MNKNTNTLSGRRFSFYKLFRENYRISIPIIQRDYAQGRQTTKEVRNIFLDALYAYLEEDKENRDLDFVYGSLDETDEKTEFIPLDGQQRLTTLFLLHWYLCQISENKEKKAEFMSFLLKDGKSMFTYETRSSSTEFCDALMGNDINFKELLDADKDSDGNGNDKSLSKTIENSSWFFLSWKYDPTIQSMLTMLDAIHDKFADKKEYFERLTDLEKPIITFLFLNLKDFKLSDDLYIKMNSRGKQLTAFENFKAKIEQYLEDSKIKRKIVYDEKEKEVSLKEYFSYKIDTEWAYLFWNYRDLVTDKNKDEKNTYDAELKNFIRVIFANQYAMSYEKDEKLEFLLGTQVAKKRKDYTDNISFYKYKELDAISEQSVLYLIDALDNLKNKRNKIKTHLPVNYKNYFDENAVFEKVLNNQIAIIDRVLFHAYIRFLIEKADRTGIEQWIRVIHNLAVNTPIDGADEVSKAVKSIEKLIEKIIKDKDKENDNIIKYLCQNPKIDFFSSWQVLEEKIKAHLINKGDIWKNKIENTEKYFEGQIGFILEFSGIVKYYERKQNCDWSEEENEDYLNSFSNYVKKAEAVFNNKDNYNNEFVWERAVLTKGDYLITASAWRKNLLFSKADTRTYSWKTLLRIKNDKNDEGEKNQTFKRKLVQQVFDDVPFDVDGNNIKNSLEKICEKKTDTWRDYLITCPELIEYCKQGFIRFINDNDIILLGQSQMNHLHAEMYTYFLWYKVFKDKQSLFSPFNPEYYYSKSSYDNDASCIVLKNFCLNGINYKIRIYYCHKDNTQEPYKIVFNKLNNENSDENNEDDIKNILKDLIIKKNEKEGYYFSVSKDSDTLIEKLKKMIEKISI